MARSIFGAANFGHAQANNYGLAPAASYDTPSLLPMPDVTPASSYGYGTTGPAARFDHHHARVTHDDDGSRRAGLGATNDSVPGTAVDQYPVNTQPVPAQSFAQQAAPAPCNCPRCSAGGGTGLMGGGCFGNAFRGCWADCCNCGGMWFGSVGGIAMTRNNANRFWTSYQTNNNPDQLMNTQHAHADWGGGGEVTIGRWFGGAGNGLAAGGLGAGGSSVLGCNTCGMWGLSATYWGLSPLTGSASVTDPTNNISTPIDLGYVNIHNSLQTSPNPASYFFDNSPNQTLQRVDRINNVEVNFINQTALNSPRTQAIWLAGIRYFRFDETLTYGSVAYGHTFSESNGAYSAFLRNHSVNNLIGPQIGVQMSHYFTPRLGLFLTPKFGIFGNGTQSQTTLYTGDGVTQFNLVANKNVFSTVGQLDLGMNYLVTPRFSVYGGYRLVAITSVLLSDNQFLPFLADTQGFLEPKSNGSLILNGAFGGIQYRF